VDSSLVTALMQSISSSPINTFTVGFDEKKFNEANYAKSVANFLGTKHNELIMDSSEALNVIPSLANVYDEPFADASQIPTLLISSYAKTKVTVALSGDGGDELLGGYRRHTMMPSLWKKISSIPKPARKLMASGMQVFSEELLDHMFPGAPHFGQGVHKFSSIMAVDSSEEIYKSIISRFKNPESIVTQGREPFLKNLNSSFFPKDLDITESVIYADTIGYLPNDILTKVDRATMSVSLESRAPLLDYNLMKFCWSLPLKYKIRNGQGKWLMRQVLARYVPQNLFERPKMGFSVPISDWLRGPLKEWCDDLINEKKLSQDGILNSDKVVDLWEHHQSGKKNYSEQLWSILMFIQWKERWASKH
jgi:asparagine synthase (glutamine-hydrolysing)